MIQVTTLLRRQSEPCTAWKCRVLPDISGGMNPVTHALPSASTVALPAICGIFIMIGPQALPCKPMSNPAMKEMVSPGVPPVMQS